MYCPSCGAKLRKIRIEPHDFGTFEEDDILYKCPECKAKWVSTWSSFDQETVIKKLAE